MTIVYLIFIMLAAYCSLRYDSITEPNAHKEHRYWLLCAILIAIEGFSYGLGGDKFVYMESFETLPIDLPIQETIYFEFLLQGYMPLWTILNVVVKRATDSFYVLQFVQATIVNITFCYIGCKYTKRYFLFLLLYFLCGKFFLFNTEVMREALAIAIMMIGIERYYKKDYISYVLCFILGFLFHLSASLMLLFPFVKFRINKYTLPACFIISFFFWAVSDILLGSAAIFALGGSIGVLIQKVLYYSTTATTIFGFLRSAITFIIVPFIVMYFSYQWETDEDIRQKKQKFISFAMVLGIIGSSFAGFSRFRNYVEIYYLCMLADFVYMLFRTKEHLIIRIGTMMVFVFLISLDYLVYYPYNKAYFIQRYVPYTCILNEDHSVYYREAIHAESVMKDSNDKNTRDIKD